jgi:hypothetical protein
MERHNMPSNSRVAWAHSLTRDGLLALARASYQRGLDRLSWLLDDERDARIHDAYDSPDA